MGFCSGRRHDGVLLYQRIVAFFGAGLYGRSFIRAAAGPLALTSLQLRPIRRPTPSLIDTDKGRDPTASPGHCYRASITTATHASSTAVKGSSTDRAWAALGGSAPRPAAARLQCRLPPATPRRSTPAGPTGLRSDKWRPTSRHAACASSISANERRICHKPRRLGPHATDDALSIGADRRKNGATWPH